MHLFYYRAFSSRARGYVNVYFAHASAILLHHAELSINGMAVNLSSYAAGLPSDAKERYIQKISLINSIDPFLGAFSGVEIVSELPPVDITDLLSYLVLKTSFMTVSQFKGRKSLEAYNQFVSGWVKNVETRKIAAKYLTTGRVSCHTVMKS